jgi:pyridoxine 4-dehydrogenase
MNTSTPRPEHTLGRLGERQVLRVGFGAMQLSAAHADETEKTAATAILRKAVEVGVDHVDTAEFYGGGSVNELIRAALHPYPAGLQLVSKVGAEEQAGGLVPAQRPEQLRAGVEANLASLGVEQLAAVNLRRVDAGPGIIATGDQIVDLDSQLAELIALRDEGKIAGIGLSNVSADQLHRSLPAGIVCVQNFYNLLDRTHEPALLECETNGVAWVPFFPLGSAFAHLPSVTASDVVIAHAARLGITPAQAGLAWLLARSPQTLLIPGTRNPEHLAENIAAADIELDADALAAFDAVAPAASAQ